MTEIPDPHDYHRAREVPIPHKHGEADDCRCPNPPWPPETDGPPREKVTTVGYQETAAKVAQLVGATGAYRFALLWTHPDHPEVDRPDDPPADVPVTWTAVACFHGGPRRVARDLQLEKSQLELVDGHVVVATSCYGLDHGKSIATASAELCRRLGANVTFAGAEPARLVDNPPDALQEAIRG